MKSVSRRLLARHAVNYIQSDSPDRSVPKGIAAELLATGRRGELELLVKDIEAELEATGQLVVGKVYCRYLPSPDQQAEVINFVKAQTGSAKAELEFITDSKILGGVNIETATRSWDLTLNRTLGRLKTMAKEMN